MTERFTLSNFRKEETIQDWPLGSNRRGPCVFTHESNKKGQRILRTTTGKPKASTYYDRVCLVDGSDGKTHFIGWTQYDFLSVMSCDMKLQDFTIFEKDPHFEEYKTALFAVTGELPVETPKVRTMTHVPTDDEITAAIENR